jgi:hypothetical protein
MDRGCNDQRDGRGVREYSEMFPDDTRAEVERLWALHLRAPFPTEPHLRDDTVAGMDLALLDADVAGCVSTWIGTNGSLDSGRKDVLTASICELDRAFPLIPDGPSREYFERLRTLAETVLKAS